jgi:hypothetical protein
MTAMPDKLDAALRIIEDYPGFHMGPTVPFVLGALRDPIGAAPAHPDEGRIELSHLLRQLSAAPAGRGVRIQWCRNIKAYVATSMPFVEGLAWDVEGCGPDDFEGLVASLWQLYGTFITAGEFSIDDYVWHSLTSDEIRTVEWLLDGSEPADRPVA